MLQNESYCLWPSLSLFPISHTLTHTSRALQVELHVSYFYIMAFSTSPLHRMDYPRRWETGNSENSHTQLTMYDSPCEIQIYSTHKQIKAHTAPCLNVALHLQSANTDKSMHGRKKNHST